MSNPQEPDIPATPAPRSEPTPDQPQQRPFQFGIASLLLITTLCAVVMGISVVVPGIGIAIAVLTVPALVRTYVLVRRSRPDGKPASMEEKVVLFMSCLGIALLIALATGAAFFVTCLIGFSGASAAPHTSLGASFSFGLISGLLVGGGLLLFLMIKWFRYPARSPDLRTRGKVLSVDPPRESDP